MIAALQQACVANGLAADDGWGSVRATIRSRPRRRNAASEIAGRAMTDVLRPYQVEVIAEFWRAVEAGQRRIIIVAPTASGKTVIARAIVEQARSKGCGSLFLAHRREILTQTSNKLRGIPHGIIRPGDQPRPLEPVQVASVQTLHRRAIKAGTMELPEARPRHRR